MLDRTTDQDERGRLFDAFARIGDPSVLPKLESLYATEEKEPRWFVLKAMGYIGTDESLAFVKSHGLTDANRECQILANDILGTQYTGK